MMKCLLTDNEENPSNFLLTNNVDRKLNEQFTHLLVGERFQSWKQTLLPRGKEIHLNLDLDLLSFPPCFLSEIESRSFLFLKYSEIENRGGEGEIYRRRIKQHSFRMRVSRKAEELGASLVLCPP